MSMMINNDTHDRKAKLGLTTSKVNAGSRVPAKVMTGTGITLTVMYASGLPRISAPAYVYEILNKICSSP